MAAAFWICGVEEDAIVQSANTRTVFPPEHGLTLLFGGAIVSENMVYAWEYSQIFYGSQVSCGWKKLEVRSWLAPALKIP